MRVARRNNIGKTQVSIIRSVPAPVGGVNARDALASMPPTDAIIMDNWFPNPAYVQIRNGNIKWATGLPAAVETVMAYNGLTIRTLFAISNGSFYDVTSPGPVGAAIITGQTNSRWQHAMFNAGGGNVLLCVNGADAPRVYDGSSWGTTTIAGSGLTPANLITVTVFQQRVWFIESNTMNVWYSATSAYQGTLTQIPLGQLFKKGGTLMQMATWTIDNVDGINDYAAFITTEGEVAIYQGYDPSQLATWSLVGIFSIGRPIGRRCITKLASDVLVITADGLTPLSKALLTDRTQENVNLTYKISNAINGDVQGYSANFGWQVIDYPIGNKVIVNVPELPNSTMHQWVMNSVTQAWCRFKNWNANCWEVQQDSLYFGGDQAVYLADVGLTDAGMAISVDCKPAFSYLEMPGVEKLFEMARPIFNVSAAITPQINLNVDFDDVDSPPPVFNGATTSAWDVSPWDTTPWSGTLPVIIVKNWQGIAGVGYACSGRIQMQVSKIAVQWISTDYMFAAGGPI